MLFTSVITIGEIGQIFVMFVFGSSFVINDSTGEGDVIGHECPPVQWIGS